MLQGLEKPGILCCLLGCIMPCIPTLLLRQEARERYNIEVSSMSMLVSVMSDSMSGGHWG